MKYMLFMRARLERAASLCGNERERAVLLHKLADLPAG